MHRQSGRFVHNHNVVIFVHHVYGDVLRKHVRRDRNRNTDFDFLFSLESVSGVGRASVNCHFSVNDKPLDPRARKVSAQVSKERVEANA